jgi:hypothetical protein
MNRRMATAERLLMLLLWHYDWFVQLKARGKRCVAWQVVILEKE